MSEMSAFSEMYEYMGFADSMTSWIEAHMSYMPDDFPPVDKYMGKMMDYMEKKMAEIESKDIELTSQIRITEDKMAQLKKLIMFLQNNHAELWLSCW